MIIEGRIIAKKNAKVRIKQFWTGYVYEFDSRDVKVRGTPVNPEKTDDGYLIGKVEGIGQGTDYKLVHF